MINLIEDRQKRNEIMENVKGIKTLEQVKKILTLGNSDFVTVQMTAEYFDVNKNTIEVLISRNKEELKSNGLKVLSGKEIKDILVTDNMSVTNHKGYFTADGNKFANRNNTLISKRVLLNIAMLLRDSEVAKEVRRRLLDVVFDAEEDKGSINTIVEELNEEEKIAKEALMAFMNGDIEGEREARAKLVAFKNRRIKELEDKNDKLEQTIVDIVADNITYEKARKELVANLKNISIVCHNSNFKKTYTMFYKFLYEKGYNLELRRTRNAKHWMNEEEDLGVEVEELKYVIDLKKEEIKCVKRNTKKYITLREELNNLKCRLKELNKEYKKACKEYSFYIKCSKLDLIKDEEFPKILEITRAWSLSLNYDWREGLVDKEDIDLPL